MSIHIYRKIIKNGVEIKIKNKKIQLVYPTPIWEKFPRTLHKIFADTTAYLFTWQLPLINKDTLVCHFSNSLLENLFFKILIYSIPMNIFDDNQLKTSELIKDFLNLNFLSQFKGNFFSSFTSGKKIKAKLKERAILLFSFGKESLLTYGLLKEMKIEPILIFIKEPLSQFENIHKKKLAKDFFNDFKDKVCFFPIDLGLLRQNTGMYWGWEIILSQYIFLLVPYLFYYQCKYLFLGNEQSCNFYLPDKEGFFINPVFEQSLKAMEILQNIPKQFFIKTLISSLVLPIHEIFITYILHYRYSNIGKYQMSCFSEEETAKRNRWCGQCEKCARIYIFLKALNINPKKVNFVKKNMLSLKKEKLYVLFNRNSVDSAYGSSGLGRDEQLLAFYLAYKNKVKGQLIDKFARLYLKEAKKKKHKLIKTYFNIFNNHYLLPFFLKKKIIKIFIEEKENVLQYIKKILSS